MSYSELDKHYYIPILNDDYVFHLENISSVTKMLHYQKYKHFVHLLIPASQVVSHE